jgi:hypothetical protein
LIAQSDQETICNEFDVLFHEFGIDSQQWTRQTVCQKSLFNSDGFGDDILNDLFARSLTKMAEEETSKVGVKTFVSGDEFVGEGQAWHEAAFLEPKDGCE